MERQNRAGTQEINQKNGDMKKAKFLVLSGVITLLFLAFGCHQDVYIPTGIPGENADIDEIFPDSIGVFGRETRLLTVDDVCYGKGLEATYGDSSEITIRVWLFDDNNCATKFLNGKIEKIKQKTSKVKKMPKNVNYFEGKDSDVVIWRSENWVFEIKAFPEYFNLAVDSYPYIKRE